MGTGYLLISGDRKLSLRKRVAAFAIASISVTACSGSNNVSTVTFVDRSKVFAADNDSDPVDPYMLVVEIDEAGRLTLNKIQVGNIIDPDSVKKELKSIFDDREVDRVESREVIVATKGWVSRDNLELLIDRLTDAKAGPIVIVNSPN